MSSSSFEEAMQFAFESLHMEDLDPREAQLSSPLRQYTMDWTCLCAYQQDLEKSLLLPGHSFHNGLQDGQSWDFQN